MEKWIENFNNEVASLQIEFDSYFTNGRITDYFKLIVDEEHHSISLYFFDTHELPKHIIEALTAALYKSKPNK